ncbi:hypothetical protein [Streptomyces sp. CBMA152]|uniref:hypothetical protein n=1 Tax=Streptomyces sp. CBMA152 TaxID=1896312 RepID=UPI001660D403|nr:hypothetical protein [Streptomyces sp. CBMA152]
MAATLELTAVDLAPPGIRPLLSGFLLGAAVAILALSAVLAHRHRQIAARHHPAVSPESVDASWFTARALDGFPMESVRPDLLGPNAPDLNRLYLAWILATHGHDTNGLIRRLGLSHDVAALLVDSAQARRDR